MRSIIATLLLFLTFAFAQETIYTTRTVYRVVTETQTGVAPTNVANSTSVLSPSAGTVLPTGAGNATAPIVGSPTGPVTQPSAGAASGLNANAGLVAAMIALGAIAL